MSGKVWWATFEGSGFTHVAPCDKTGVLMKPHTLEMSCKCNPSFWEEYRLIIHEVLQ